jgi:hypothetical protein
MSSLSDWSDDGSLVAETCRLLYILSKTSLWPDDYNTEFYK